MSPPFLKIGLPLFCVVVSVAFIFFGGMTLIFTTGVYLLIPLVWFLYGLWNLFLILLASTASRRRRVMWLSGIPSALAVIGFMLVADGPGVLIWCGVIVLNWLAIKTLADLHTATDATSGA